MFIIDKFFGDQLLKLQQSKKTKLYGRTANKLSGRTTDKRDLQQALERWTRSANADHNDLESRLKLIEINGTLRNSAEIKRLISELDESRFATVRDAQLVVARHYFDAHKNDKALKKWAEINKQYADQSESCEILAQLYLRVGAFDEAHQYANMLAEKHGLAAKAYEIRAAIYLKQELWSEAAESLTEVLEDAPSDDLEKKLILALLKDNQLDKAMQKVNDGLHKNPDCTRRLSLKHNILQRKKNWHSALNVVNKLIELQSPNKKLLASKCDLLYKLMRLDESECLCENILKEKPQDIQMLTLYARISQKRLNQIKAA